MSPIITASTNAMPPPSWAKWSGRGQALPVAVEGWNEKAAFIHREDLPLLEAVQAGEHEPTADAQFLSPFDNLFWDLGRDEMLWDFLLSHRGLHAQSQARLRLLCHANPAWLPS